MESIVDVLIIGSGPSGLALAIDFERFGISFRIIDKDIGLTNESRALGIHSRTLEMLKQRRLENHFIEKGIIINSILIHDKEKEIGALKLSQLGVPYPFVLVLPQSETEEILYEHLLINNKQVEFETELIDFIQNKGLIEAKVRHKGSEEIIISRWLVGCDGAASKVREVLAFDTTEDKFEELFLLADLDIEWKLQKDKVYLWTDNDGVAVSIPLPVKNHWRVILNYPPQSENFKPKKEFFENMFQERSGLTEVKFKNSSWISDFKIKERNVSHYRRKNVFLVGDAAHIHSPLGAQGMNTGIQDAFNLAWKLKMVIKDEANDSLLDTYEEERKPIADKVTFFTGASTSAMTSRNPIFQFTRNQILSGIVNFSFLQQKVLWQLSELGVNYKGSSISSLAEKETLKKKFSIGSGIAPGERAPQANCYYLNTKAGTSLFEIFSKPGFHLLLIASELPDKSKEKEINEILNFLFQQENNWIHPVCILTNPKDVDFFQNIKAATLIIDINQEIIKKYAAAKGLIYLIRPDGYVAFRDKEFNLTHFKKFWKNLRDL